MIAEKFLSFIIKNTRKKYFRLKESNKENPIKLLEAEKSKNYPLYIHIPFCEELCPYCSFNRYEYKEEITKEYFKYLRKEINIYKDFGFTFKELYIGGGTPTIDMKELEKLIYLLKSNFPIQTISVETNPNHLTNTNLSILKQLEVNRLSVGVQSFDNNILKSMKRYDKYGSSERIKNSIKMANNYFNTLNIDMIFNFPDQTIEMLEKDLNTLLDLDVGQVTYYPLMPSTNTNKAIKKIWDKISYKKEKTFYYTIVDKLSYKLKQTTVWCFSKNNSLIDEYIVNTNEYVGLGSGAFGYLNGSIYINEFSIQRYINKLKDGILPNLFKKEFTIKEQTQYDFLIKLFGKNLNIENINNRYSINFLKYFKKELFFFNTINGIRIDDKNISLKRKGLYYWLIMMREFFINVNNFRDYCRQTYS